jgi:hypothetical protein|tara:strand:+ start:414 stop:2057 length:1644 start_codon:yes stop_codon:yes gene_type:complete
MVFEDEQHALRVIKANLKPPTFIQTSREESKTLFALLQGDDFLTELIDKIEHIESEEKQTARKKYSRDIAHFFERLLRPVDNVYSATGGSKTYDLKGDKQVNLRKKISRIRDGKSLQEWLEATWMPLYHSDPNGVIFLEYKDGDVWPTYKNIDHIKAYKPKGQLVDWIIFEPKEVKTETKVVYLWRIVDDLIDRTFIQDGESFTLLEERTFEHPFGQVPAIINSDIKKLKATHRISPLDKVLELSKEFARDQSVKTILKFQHGFPIHWKYVSQCKTCFGSGKDEDKECGNCDGHGYMKNKDVTDLVTLPTPEADDVKLAPDLAGFISPDLSTWTQYTEEIQMLEEMAHQTHWGTLMNVVQGTAKTATEIIINSQPVINRLNKYADVAEMMEGKLTEWIANFLDEGKDKSVKVASINYGRRYIIDPPDVILEKYEKAKKEGDNSVILDRLLNEYFTAKYNSDPEWLGVMLIKAQVEPYLHNTIEQVNSIFGRVEAQRKILFESWWGTLMPNEKKDTPANLITKFDAWFQAKITATTPVEPDSKVEEDN